jgi:hypothetical protein
VSLTTPEFGGGQGKHKQEHKPKPDEHEEENGETEKKESGKGTNGLELKGNAQVEKERMDIFQENEVTLSVTYSGGGQELKERMLSCILPDITF